MIEAQVRRRVLHGFSRYGLLDPDDARDMLAWDNSGFSLDAGVCIAGNDGAGLERLLRYCARPPFALERIEQVNEDRIVYRLPKPQRDGRTALSLTPLDLIDHLVALIPPPRLHRHRYPSRRASARPAGHPPGTTHRSMPYRTGTPWRNRSPSTSSTRKSSGSLFPSSPTASDAPLPAPRPRKATPHGPLASSEGATLPPSIFVGPPGDANLAPASTARAVELPIFIKLLTRLDLDLKSRLLEAAEEEAIRVFARNLSALLLAAPAGRLPTLGLDPGLRTGLKVAVVDGTGRVAATDTIFPHVPRNQWDQAIARLAVLAKTHGVKLISTGNGTASRETDRLARDLIKRHPELGLRSLVVSEAGASVYSASEYASKELPELDVSLRGAVSIARRLQDPLAELVKIEPKAIGVGQYQHDVNQSQLAHTLEKVVEDCVNAVGVDLNTASVPLLAQVSGLTQTLAENIVRFREERGAFPNRAALRSVPRLGDKTFQLCAGFLRVPDGTEPLDASAVHPEAYPVVRRILTQAGKGIRELIGDVATLRRLNPTTLTDDQFGLPTVKDILTELEKPGRDPRPEFKAAEFLEGVETLEDLKEGMVLEGTVTNVTNFVAFVDMGVHQDGLVHISALADRFVKDPHEVVKTGDLVKVKVMEVDRPRKRIALTMRLRDEPGTRTATQEARGGSDARSRPGASPRADARSERATPNRKSSPEPTSGPATALGGLWPVPSSRPEMARNAAESEGKEGAGKGPLVMLWSVRRPPGPGQPAPRDHAPVCVSQYYP